MREGVRDKFLPRRKKHTFQRLLAHRHSPFGRVFFFLNKSFSANIELLSSYVAGVGVCTSQRYYIERHRRQAVSSALVKTFVYSYGPEVTNFPD